MAENSVSNSTKVGFFMPRTGLNNGIVIGEWCCVDEGIAILERIHDFYHEEYHQIPHDKKIGDFYMSAVEYKVFCDYDGQPIKRNRYRVSSIFGCKSLDARNKKVLDKSIKKHTKEYASFLKLLKTKKISNDCITLIYSIDNEYEEKIAQDFEKIKKSLPQKFTFEDVTKIAIANHCVLDFTNTIYDTFLIPDYCHVYLRYTLGDFSGKRILFHDFDYEERFGGGF